MYDTNWLFRGAQSALFYYVSCAPCTKFTADRKRRKQNERDRRDREATNAHNPEQYRQPSPYRTNAYWSEEINLGPGPPPKRASKKQRDAKSKPAELGGAESPAPSGGNSSPDISALDTVKQKIHQAGERWNSRRYQREDEPLWGTSQHGTKHGSAQGTRREDSFGGSSILFPALTGHDTARSSTETFYTAKVPPLNDLHPPVVSNPSSNKQSNRWMLQPPPPASVMGGYEQSNRSRSDSGTSSRRGGDIPLSRQVGEKILEKKLQNGESVPSIGSLRRARQADGEGQNHDRTGSPRPKSTLSASHRAPKYSDNSAMSNETVIHRKFTTDSKRSQDTADSGIGEVDFAPNDPSTYRSRRVSETPSPEHNTPLLTPLPRARVKRPPIVTKDSSLHILQELVSPHTLLNSKIVSRSPIEARIKLPGTDAQEEFELNLMERDFRLTRRPPWELDYDADVDEEDAWDGSERRTRWSIG